MTTDEIRQLQPYDQDGRDELQQKLVKMVVYAEQLEFQRDQLRRREEQTRKCELAAYEEIKRLKAQLAELPEREAFFEHFNEQLQAKYAGMQQLFDGARESERQSRKIIDRLQGEVRLFVGTSASNLESANIALKAGQKLLEQLTELRETAQPVCDALSAVMTENLSEQERVAVDVALSYVDDMRVLLAKWAPEKEN